MFKPTIIIIPLSPHCHGNNEIYEDCVHIVVIIPLLSRFYYFRTDKKVISKKKITYARSHARSIRTKNFPAIVSPRRSSFVLKYFTTTRGCEKQTDRKYFAIIQGEMKFTCKLSTV
jgi:hypothetical protein